MSDNEDLELQALQRKLDDAFATTRPRAGFEDDLWSRMQARRPLPARIQGFVARLVASVRVAPAAPAAAVAVVLVLAIGIGVVARSGFHLGGGGAATSSQSGGSQFGAAAPAQGGPFGRLPTPALQPVPGTADTIGPKTSYPTANNVYLGPATLVWAGQLNIPVASAPVFRYQEPTAADADNFATALGASAVSSGRGTYSGNGFTLAIVGSSRTPLGEPVYYITIVASKQPPQYQSASDAAMEFLSSHGLLPTWTHVIAVDQVADVARVSYLRQFAVPGYGPAYLVDTAGTRYGLEADVRNGQLFQVRGPLPVNLDSAEYPIISAAQAVSAALKSSPAVPASIQPVPTIRLTTAELVYALVNAGDHSFYEPAYLFSGTFTVNGVTLVKRVLVPAVAQ